MLPGWALLSERSCWMASLGRDQCGSVAGDVADTVFRQIEAI
jgi:hypothetical protein